VEEAEETANSGVEESELDEMWSFVRKKTNPRWLWHAIDRQQTSISLRFGRRKDEVFRALKKLLEPFGIKQYCTDGWGAYERNQSKRWARGKTQRIERK